MPFLFLTSYRLTFHSWNFLSAWFSWLTCFRSSSWTWRGGCSGSHFPVNNIRKSWINPMYSSIHPSIHPSTHWPIQPLMNTFMPPPHSPTCRIPSGPPMGKPTLLSGFWITSFNCCILTNPQVQKHWTIMEISLAVEPSLKLKIR